MQFHILGLGSIGTFLAHNLRRVIPHEYPITLIHRLRTQAERTIASGNIVRVERNGVVTPSTGYLVDAYSSLSPNQRGAPYNPEPISDKLQNFNSTIDSLFVTTKAHQALPAIQKLAPRLNANSTIVLLQNGMGLYEELTSQVFRNAEYRPHFILASNTHGVFTKGFHHVVHTGPGALDFGIVADPLGRNFETSLYNEDIPLLDRQLRLSDITNSEDPNHEKYKSLRDTVAALLLLEPLHSTWRPMHEMQVQLRRKLVVNAVINPLTAVMGCRNGDLFTTPAAHRILNDVCYEASKVYLAEFQSETDSYVRGHVEQGADLDNVDIQPFPQGLTKAALEEEVLRVAEATKGNISSMLTDVRRGEFTEIEYINGYLLTIARMHSINMPVNSTLINLVRLRCGIPLDQQL